MIKRLLKLKLQVIEFKLTLKGTQRLGAGNQCLYCPFWARGPLDDNPTHRNPVALEWHKS